MKQFLLFISLLLLTQQTFAQCLTLKQMRAFYFMDLEQRDALMSSKGFAVDVAEDRGVIWQTDYASFSVDFDANGKVWNTSLHTRVNSCYNLTKSQIAAAGLKKDAEFNTHNSLFFFYSNALYGVKIEKDAPFRGVAYYEIQILRKKEYLENLQKFKEMPN